MITYSITQSHVNQHSLGNRWICSYSTLNLFQIDKCIWNPFLPALLKSSQQRDSNFILREIPQHFTNTSRGINFDNMFAWHQTLKGLLAIFHSFSGRKELHTLAKTSNIIFPNFTWSHPCVQVLHIHVFCCCAMRRCTYHRLDQQQRPRHLSSLRSLPRTENYLPHHNSHHSDNKAHSTVHSTGGCNGTFARIHTIWSSNTDSTWNKLHPCFGLVFPV